MEATAVKERPILFSGAMVRAILADKKTQTRRLVKCDLEPGEYVNYCAYSPSGFAVWKGDGCTCREVKYPYGWVGDRLRVRETWADVNTESGPAILYAADNALRFCSDDAYPVEYERYPKCQFTMWWSDLIRRSERGCEGDHHWRPSIFMPNWASRLSLEIASEPRVERLHDIPPEDVLKEGFVEWTDPPRVTTKHYGLTNADAWEPDPVAAFGRVWKDINGKDSWDANPFVWVVEFKRVVG